MATATVTRPAFIPATDRQITYIDSLIAGRDLDASGQALASAYQQIRAAGTLDKLGASTIIGVLTSQRRKATAPKPATADTPATTDVPEGRYLVDATIYRVDKPTGGRWDGWTFVKVIDERDREIRRLRGKEAAAALAAIAEAGPLNAAIAYGKKTIRCARCGIELTNENSRERGIGPICIDKY